MTSSYSLVPKAELSAYQRWEVASLAEAAEILADADAPAAWDGGASEREAAAAAAAVAAAAAAKALQAQQDGHDAGYAAGMVEAADARTRLEVLLASIAENAGTYRQQLLDEVLDFSLLLARRMVGKAFAVHRELVLPVVNEALKELPQMSQSVRVLLNPDDVELVRTFLAAEPTPVGYTLFADATIAPGGCRIAAEQCEIDATVETRWRRLIATLGCSDEWLAPA